MCLQQIVLETSVHSRDEVAGACLGMSGRVETSCSQAMLGCHIWLLTMTSFNRGKTTSTCAELHIKLCYTMHHNEFRELLPRLIRCFTMAVQRVFPLKTAALHTFGGKHAQLSWSWCACCCVKRVGLNNCCISGKGGGIQSGYITKSI